MKDIDDFDESSNELDAVFLIMAVLIGMFFGGLLTYFIISNFKLL